MPFKIIKVSHPGPGVFHLKSTVIGTFAKGLFATALLFTAARAAGNVSAVASIAVPSAPNPVTRADLPESGCLFEAGYDQTLLGALDKLYRMDYAGADSAFAALPEGPARNYFRGLALINRFDDLGDTSALFRAEALWEEVYRADADRSAAAPSPGNLPLYRGLAALQLGYVASITGSGIRAAHLGRKAVGILRPLSRFAEAEAALALYDYYKADLLKGVKWMPFIEADAAGPLRRLEAAIPRSRYLRDLLRTSLLWLYYDAGRYDQGLEPIGEFLARYPGNRFYRKVEADFRFRNGDLDSALALHQALAREYSGLRTICPSADCIPIGYLGSVGNLAKIHASQKHPELLKKQLEIWYSPEQGGIMKWMPASLKREVGSLRK